MTQNSNTLIRIFIAISVEGLLYLTEAEKDESD